MVKHIVDEFAVGDKAGVVPIVDPVPVLQEARRLMVGRAFDAAAAGYEVGYESPSQFTREYRRLFGASPVPDVTRLRNERPDLAMA
jgi:hypothetical protein